MGFRRKTDDLNNKPFDRGASPEKKSEEFDRQYQQNRKYTDAPNAEAAGAKKGKGRHAK